MMPGKKMKIEKKGKRGKEKGEMKERKRRNEGKKKRVNDNFDTDFCDNCSLLFIILTFHFLR